MAQYSSGIEPPAESIRIHTATRVVDTGDEQLHPVRATDENIRSHGRSTLDSHLLATLQFKQTHLSSEGFAIETVRPTRPAVVNTRLSAIRNNFFTLLLATNVPLWPGDRRRQQRPHRNKSLPYSCTRLHCCHIRVHSNSSKSCAKRTGVDQNRGLLPRLE